MKETTHSILCVDDNPDILDFYETFFKEIASFNVGHSLSAISQGWAEVCPYTFDQSYDIVLAGSGEEAITKVQSSKDKDQCFSLGLINMDMVNGITGYDAIKQILKIDNEIHCALVSKTSDMEISRLTPLFQFQDQFFIMPRPVDFHGLFQVSKNLLASWQMKQKNKTFTHQLKQQTEKNREISEHLILLNQFSKRLSTCQDHQEPLQNILDELLEIIDAEIGSLLLLEPGETLYVIAASGPDRDEVLGLKNPVSQARLSNYTLKNKKPLILKNGMSIDFWGANRLKRPLYESIISVPLMVKNQGIGVINFGTTAQNKKFSQKECDLITIIASQIAMTLENNRIMNELKDSCDKVSSSYLLTIRALTKAIDAKDHYTFGHSNRVAYYSKEIARELGLTDDKLNILDWSCILHDIGKIGISESILNKKGALTDEEFGEIRTHSTRGYEIIKEIPHLKEVTNIILYHHERHDGRGYPCGIPGGEIPLNSAVIAVSDAFDAMTSDRPYRRGMSPQNAFNEIIRCNGTQFSPLVVEAFVTAYHKKIKQEFDI
jgi:putative nucleotidyltransferase with HDIG domain